ncbi:prolyl oligopeptidase family serine peptidase [Timonella sp. A28]|uniref:prolyl oligopeptidase family serine peptidase n=1 Tax=Timonella sp. A28 TaxID=3442640 RepID=UPI003EC15248
MNTPPPTRPHLEADLATWEHHGRPGLPHNGFMLSRPAGQHRRGIYRADTGAALCEPDEHILRMEPAPDRQHITLQLAEHANEEGYLAILDTTNGHLDRYPHIRCRYEPMRWATNSTLELVARTPRALIHLDTANNTHTTTPVTESARVRLFPGGTHGTLVESTPGSPTRVINRATNLLIASYPSVMSVHELGPHILVHTRDGIHVVDPHTGVEQWSWCDPNLTITALATTRDTVYVTAVRAAASILLTLVAGEIRAEQHVQHGGSIAVATDLRNDGNDTIYALIEAPTLPPHVVTAKAILNQSTSLKAQEPLAHTTLHTVLADDGETLTVAVTSPSHTAGPTPLILSCYGGFGVADLPVFEPTIPAWIQHGGRYATAHVRGGGEHGTTWREAGRGRNKHRSIADLECIARALIDAELTRPELLILVGASHGGVLVASCAFGAPELCAAVITTAAPLDLLALEQHPLGAHWIQEFGDPHTSAGRDDMQRISPLHRAQTLPAGTTPPAFLGIVLEHDSRIDAEATHNVAAALTSHGASATVWQAPNTGHGSNHLNHLHTLGAVILSFAATATHTATAPTGRTNTP